jgi:hypothetical protein
VLLNRNLVFYFDLFGIRIELIEIIELTHLTAEDMNDNSAVVHYHPRVIRASALNAVSIDLDILELILNPIGKSLYVGI